ncbi:mitochondrial import inner membrane translocase subunit TIM50-C [Hyalella azteca]|uniref:Mitochondrial import inner membrane translocase subunit TIM50 n=1 Tax=Hyalella azteca TaxID=294128 RepID=A0A8B7PQS8_HYAAZ|nr:mitochondrial import inner membrane translocase subunit TIM50-C [Hyalella azteca]
MCAALTNATVLRALSTKFNTGLNLSFFRSTSFSSNNENSTFYTSHGVRMSTKYPVRWSISNIWSKNYCQSYAKKSEETSLAQDLLTSRMDEEKRRSGSYSKEEAEADEKQRKEDLERANRALKFSFIAFGVMMAGIGGTLILRWGAPPEDDDGNWLEDDFSHLPIVEQYFRRTYRELRNMNTMIQMPSREKLLPDTLSGQYVQPPYTLVLEMKDVLVHPEWTYETGWRFKKRPSLDFLLQHCAPPLFEIVIYTNEQGFTAFPVIDKLDPNGFIWYRLFKDSTSYVNGKHLKELNCLNRDLKRVIMVDWDADAVSCPRNQLKVPRWKGSMDDNGLVQLAMLLRTIAESEVDDVRDVLDYYRQFSDPLAAFEKFHKEAREREMLSEQQRKEQLKSGKVATTWQPSFLKKWF